MDNYLNSIQDIPFLRIKYVKVVRIKKGHYEVELSRGDKESFLKSLPNPSKKPNEYNRRLRELDYLVCELKYRRKGGWFSADAVCTKFFNSWSEADHTAQRLVRYIKKLQDEEEQEKKYFPDNVYKVEDF